MKAAGDGFTVVAARSSVDLPDRTRPASWPRRFVRHARAVPWHPDDCTAPCCGHWQPTTPATTTPATTTSATTTSATTTPATSASAVAVPPPLRSVTTRSASTGKAVGAVRVAARPRPGTGRGRRARGPACPGCGLPVDPGYIAATGHVRHGPCQPHPARTPAAAAT